MKDYQYKMFSLIILGVLVLTACFPSGPSTDDIATQVAATLTAVAAQGGGDQQPTEHALTLLLLLVAAGTVVERLRRQKRPRPPSPWYQQIPWSPPIP